jgi:hypothetical protein
MPSYRYRDVCTSDTAVLSEAIKANYPFYSDDGITYLSDGIQFEFSGDSVNYSHYIKKFNGNAAPTLTNISLRLPTCEKQPGVLDRDFPLDFGISVFLVLCCLMGFAVGARGHD